MQDSVKEAYNRFRFKRRVCHKLCGLWSGRGGFCQAQRDQVDYCLSIETELKEGRDYRSRETILEFLEGFCEENRIPFLMSKEIVKRMDVGLKTKKDCYGIAEEIYIEVAEKYAKVQSQNRTQVKEEIS